MDFHSFQALCGSNVGWLNPACDQRFATPKVEDCFLTNVYSTGFHTYIKVDKMVYDTFLCPTNIYG